MSCDVTIARQLITKTRNLVSFNLVTPLPFTIHFFSIVFGESKLYSLAKNLNNGTFKEKVYSQVTEDIYSFHFLYSFICIVQI